ncbi:interferon-induced 35 kDa protein isoform X2 [Apus apus]|uniref:interferon-induced 35 kDa protein isoform X2 n=1 Tax=Apus apus TaxID=8895 RepID=UPI0021F8FCA4|nr:interferon-induced 35 kDa protein isoform X2 [Apus apus]
MSSGEQMRGRAPGTGGAGTGEAGPAPEGRECSVAEDPSSLQDSFVYLPLPEAPERAVPELTAEQVRQEIERCKERCSTLEQDCAKLKTAKEAVEMRKMGELQKSLQQQMSLTRDEEISFQMDILLAKEKKDRLRQEKQVLKKKLEEVRKRVPWDDPVMLLPALPEKKMVFKGLVTNKEDINKLFLTPLIHYPLLGGSALITFEKAEVAQSIIEAKEHMVELSYGEELDELDRCRVRVQAAPVDMLLPSALEVRLTQSSRSIILSGLPSLEIPEEALLDKLELFFSKTKNGGGEVESREFLEDSGQVVMTFVQEGVAGPLIARGHIQALIGKGKYELKISPCVSGDITNLKLCPAPALPLPQDCPALGDPRCAG